MSKEIILKLEDFTISFEPAYYRSRTARDLFVEFVSHPIHKIFHPKDRLIVLRKINLEIKRGDVVGILGANGVGKTSLCRYLSGIIKSPDVLIYGRARSISESNGVFFPDLTGRENVHVLTELLYGHLSKSEKSELMNESINFSEVNEFIDTPFKNYSRGMKARVNLSVLTAKGVDLLVIDEALGGTDRFFLKKFEKRMENLILNCKAVVIVSHVTDEIEKNCNRVIVLEDKKIAYDGPVADGIKFYHSTGRR
jgi:ABC-type polysaccharide/polyol phosphate transport system ATPase subunit